MPTLLIRPACVTDAQDIARIHILAWQTAYRGLVPDAYLASMDLQQRCDSWEKLLAASQHPVVVAQSGSSLAGWADFGASRDVSAAPSAGEIYGIYLAPERWRRGIGSQLFAAAIHALAQADFSSASLWVLQDNPVARRFYERMGMSCEDLPCPVTLGGRELQKVRYHMQIAG